MKIPGNIKKLAKIFNLNGYQCYLVGGAIRDIFLGRITADYDIATDATPLEVSKIFKRTIPTGIKHGTVTVLFYNDKFEVTTFRIDDKYSDSRRPDSVKYASSIFDDLKRRDFTINGIAYDIISKKIVDPHNGISDIETKIIRAIGNPIERLNEDGLRSLRACRFAAQLGFKIEKDTVSAIKYSLEVIKSISCERIRDEFIKILQSDDPVTGIELLKETGILEYILPEIFDCIGVEQREMHCFDVYYHSIYSCGAAPKDDLVLRLAALFHDLGKAKALEYSTEGTPTFYNHENYSVEIARNIFVRLKIPNKVITEVCHLVKHHMFNYTEEWTDGAVRRFISRVHKDSIENLMHLREADSFGRCNKKESNAGLKSFKIRIAGIIDKDSVFSVKDLKITGRDIIDKLKINEGPVIGVILNYLLSSVLEDPVLNDHDKLLELSEKLYRQRIQHQIE
jgi:poly(A) polymerase/tRNA nucleotidyltransferase (CCA-adding enzyme)